MSRNIIEKCEKKIPNMGGEIKQNSNRHSQETTNIQSREEKNVQ